MNLRQVISSIAHILGGSLCAQGHSERRSGHSVTGVRGGRNGEQSAHCGISMLQHEMEPPDPVQCM